MYSLDEFIKGAANAIQGVFPRVHHASFCLLNSSRTSVNMYTFLGEGSQKPPRINVAVAPGTLIFHVLNNCQPVFVSDIATFPGPYSDVQFMRFVLGLRSVACLPLVVANARILGVLRLGFEAPCQWAEHERSLSKQLALVLSSGSHSLGSGHGGSGSMNSAGSAGGDGGADSPSTAAMQIAAAMGSVSGGWPFPIPTNGSSGSKGLSGGMGQYGDPGAATRLSHQMLALQQQQQALAAGGSNGHLSGMVPSHALAHRMGPGGVQGAGSGQHSVGSGMGMVAGPASGAVPAGTAAGGSRGGSGVHSVPTSKRPSTVSELVLLPGWQGVNDPGFDDDGMSIASASTAKASGPAFPFSQGGTHLVRAQSTLGPARGGTPGVSGLGQQAGRGPARSNQDLKLLQVIGRGGFGSVYKAVWKGELVAVKVGVHCGRGRMGCGGACGCGWGRLEMSQHLG